MTNYGDIFRPPGATRKKKKGIDKLFLLVCFLVFANVVFTWEVLVIFRETGMEPSTLIVAWFGFTTGELAIIWQVYRIKKNKEDK